MSKFDIAVAYRIYPGIGKPVYLFSNDKLKLVEFAFRSFLNALGSVRAKIFVILDNCPKVYKDTILELCQDAIIIEGTKLGNEGSFELQINQLIEQTDSDLVYFAEDDYFYLPQSIELALEFYNQHKPDFLTLYYHPDYLNWEIHNLRKPEGINFSDHFWQRIGSTTLTFFTSKATLLTTRKVFLTFTKKNYDASLWFSLTKQGIFTPKFYKLAFNPKRNWIYAKLIAKMWLFNGWQSLFGKKYTLYAPSPSLATHLEKDSLAPNVPWVEHFNLALSRWNIIK